MKLRLFYALATFATIIFVYQDVSAQNTSPYWSLSGNNNASSTTTKLGTTNGIDLRFFTNNVERLRILSSNGNVGIGSLTPTERLRIDGPSGINPVRIQVNGATKFRIDKNGGVAIGLSVMPPPNGLFVAGNVGLGVKEPKAKLDIAGSSPYVTAVQLTNGNLRVVNNFGSDDSSVGIYAEDAIGIQGVGMPGVYGTGLVGVIGSGYTGVRGLSNEGYAAIDGIATGTGTVGVNGISDFYTGVEGWSETGYGGVFTSEHNAGLRVQGHGTYVGEFYGKVFAANGFVASDRNLKQNVTEFEDAMQIIGKLKPRNYDFKTDTKYAFLHLPEGTHYGLLAQDVEEILPNLVSTSQHEDLKREKPAPLVTTGSLPPVRTKQKPESISIKAVNYVELIPIIIKAMQEQQAENDSLKQELVDQRQQITELRQMILQLKNENLDAANSKIIFLDQNSPNPARGNTLIRYRIPETSTSAHVSLTNVKGQMLRMLTISNKGVGQINVDTSALPSGTYTYSLHVDGKQVGSKQLVVAK